MLLVQGWWSVDTLTLTMTLTLTQHLVLNTMCYVLGQGWGSVDTLAECLGSVASWPCKGYGKLHTLTKPEPAMVHIYLTSLTPPQPSLPLDFI